MLTSFGTFDGVPWSQHTNILFKIQYDLYDLMKQEKLVELSQLDKFSQCSSAHLIFICLFNVHIIF